MVRLALITDPAELEQLAGRWPEPAAGGSGVPVGVSLPWVRSWYEGFTSTGQPEIWSFWDDDKWLGAIPLVRLVERAPLVARTPLKALNAAANVHTPCCGIASRRPQAVLEAFCDELARRRDGWDVVRVPRVWQGSVLVSHGPAAFARHGLRALCLPKTGQGIIGTGAGWGAWLAEHRGLAREMARKERAAHRHGCLEHDVYRGPQGLDRAFDEFLVLESAGWKGALGSAIASSDETRRFYTGLVHRAADAGWLWLGLLRLDGVPIGGEIALVAGGVVHSLKTAYHRDYASLSPGSLEYFMALRSWFADPSVREIDMGPTRHGDGKERWGCVARPTYQICLFGERGACRALRRMTAVRSTLKQTKLGGAVSDLMARRERAKERRRARAMKGART